MTDRRTFIALTVGGFLTSSLNASAQTARRLYRIGWLRLGEEPIPKPFWDAMREFGWIEGQNIEVESRYAESTKQLPALAAELVQLKVNLILADSGFATRAAKEATATIPIVFIVAADPVATGLVASLARPGGNLTGFTLGLYDEKMLETLKAALPRLSRVAVPSKDYPQLGSAGRALGVEVDGIDVRGPDEIDRFFEFARKTGADAVFIPNIPWLNPLTERLGRDATSARFPAIGWSPSFARAGGLLSYGPPGSQAWPRVAVQTNKLLRGASAADLAVELPTQFTMVINLKTAKALGIKIPKPLLLRADEVVQ